MIKDFKVVKFFLFIFLLLGIMSSYILISRDAPYDPNKTYDFVEYTQGADTLILRSGKKISLWGIKMPDRKEEKYRQVSLHLTHTVAEQNLSFLEMGKENQQVVIAKAFLSDGMDISKFMIEKGWVEEGCSITNGSYGTCEH